MLSCGGYSVHLSDVSSICGLYSLNTGSSYLSQSCQPKTHPDIAECPWEGCGAPKVTLVENDCSRYLAVNSNRFLFFVFYIFDKSHYITIRNSKRNQSHIIQIPPFLCSDRFFALIVWLLFSSFSVTILL